MIDPDQAATVTAGVIAGQLRLAAGYLDDSKLLAQHNSRNSANLLFLSAEAALIAVMTSESLHAGRATQHQLGAMTDQLPPSNPLKVRFGKIQQLTAFATTFRYVTPTGRIKDAPSPTDVVRWQAEVAAIIEWCRVWFNVDLDMQARSVASKTTPPREGVT